MDEEQQFARMGVQLVSEQSVEVEIHEGFVIDVILTLERDPDFKEDDGSIGGSTTPSHNESVFSG